MSLDILMTLCLFNYIMKKIVRIEHELESVNFRPIQYSKIYS
jgi:hypothetical protein